MSLKGNARVKQWIGIKRRSDKEWEKKNKKKKKKKQLQKRLEPV